VNAPGETVEVEIPENTFDFETFFALHYERIARTVARVVRNPARAEEIAAEAFWRLWRSPGQDQPMSWLYRTALNLALDELRKESRRIRKESAPDRRNAAPTPEELLSDARQRDRVRLVLNALSARHAELLLLRSNDFSYAEIAAALDLNPASVGTLVSRAQQAFRKEYVKQYGEPHEYR
jgi:RNA polymerase sigma-70 factor (ECF subfamily)